MSSQNENQGETLEPTHPIVKAKANVINCTDLTRGRWYRVLLDAKARDAGLLRVVDDSGEDYLYPESFFDYTPASMENGR